MANQIYTSYLYIILAKCFLYIKLHNDKFTIVVHVVALVEYNGKLGKLFSV